MTARDEGAGTMEVDDLASAARTMLAASGPFLTIWKLNEPLRLADELPLAQVIPGAWPNVEDLRKLYEASEKLRAVLANGQEVTSPADGSQVEPSTTGAGRQIIPTDDQGGEGT